MAVAADERVFPTMRWETMALSLAADKETGPVKKTKWYRQLYFWVIVAIVLGVLVVRL